jgi:hypothetical protein
LGGIAEIAVSVPPLHIQHQLLFIRICANWNSNTSERKRQVVGLNIVNVDNIRDLASHFRYKFIPENFYQVFYWMKDHVNVDGSSPLGQFYIKSKLCLFDNNPSDILLILR